MSTSNSLIERIESNVIATADSIRLFDELYPRLNTEAGLIQSGSEQVESTLFLDPFPLLQFLCPLLRSNSLPRENVTQAIVLLARYSSAKEMMMGLSERLISIGPSYDSVSSDGEDDEDESERLREGTTRGEEEEEEEWKGKQAMEELIVLIHVFGIVLPRIKSIQPIKFLTSAVEAIVSSLTVLSDQGVFTSDSIGDAEEGADDGAAVKMMKSVNQFVETIGKATEWIGDGDACSPLLQSLLLTTVALLHRELDCHLAEQYFMKQYERYRIPGRESHVALGVEPIWVDVITVARSLNIDPQTLLAMSSPSTSMNTTPSSPIASFILLAHSISHLPHLRASFLGNHTSSELLRMTLGCIMIAFGADGQSMRQGEDEALFWCWWCVENAFREGEFIVEEILFTLIELLSTLAALSPTPSIRFLAFRLVSMLIIRGTEKEEVQMMILKDLLVDCPHEAMRIAASGMLREVLMGKLIDEDSIFASPLLLDEFSPAVLRFDPPSLLDSSEIPMSVEEFLEGYYKITLEKLGFYYFLLARDQKNLTGIRSSPSINSTSISFLTPLREALDRWLPPLEAQLALVTNSPANVDQLHALVNSRSKEGELFRVRAECEILLSSLARIDLVLVGIMT